MNHVCSIGFKSDFQKIPTKKTPFNYHEFWSEELCYEKE
jgi:hypothetical protein